jgi:hypothetical protein
LTFCCLCPCWLCVPPFSVCCVDDGPRVGRVHSQGGSY